MKRVWLPVAAAMVVFGIGYAVGYRHGASTVQVAKHDETVKTKDVDHREVDTKETSTGSTISVGPTTTTRRRSTTVTSPDGTVTKTQEVEKATTGGTTTTTHNDTKDTKDKEDSVRIVERVVHDQVITPVPAPLPRVLVGVGVGLSIPGALGGDPGRQYVPFLPRVVHGVLTVDARVIGPVYAGVWATSAGAAGVGLRVGF